MSRIANNSNALCASKIVGINAVLFLAMSLHVALMPFKNKVHNHLEAGSLILNFALFDTALLVSVQGDETEKLVLGWVLDVIRIVAVTVLIGYGIYENRAGLPGCCQALTPWQRQVTIADGFDHALLADEEGDGDADRDLDALAVEGEPEADRGQTVGLRAT